MISWQISQALTPALAALPVLIWPHARGSQQAPQDHRLDLTSSDAARVRTADRPEVHYSTPHQ